MTTVVFIANTSPVDVDRTLKSWSRLRGVDRTRFMYTGAQEVAVVERMMYGVGGRSAEEVGLVDSQYVALEAAFEWEREFVIVAQTGLAVSTDVIEYFEWCQRTYEDYGNVMAVCAEWPYRPVGPIDGVHARQEFMPGVWGTWRGRWEDGLSDATRAAGESVPAALKKMMMQDDSVCMFPAWNRVASLRDTQTMVGDVVAPLVYREIM